MKIYRLKIVYNEKTEEIEYIQEDIQGDDIEEKIMYGSMELDGYFDEEGLELIEGCYIIGEA